MLKLKEELKPYDIDMLRNDRLYNIVIPKIEKEISKIEKLTHKDISKFIGKVENKFIEESEESAYLNLENDLPFILTLSASINLASKNSSETYNLNFKLPHKGLLAKLRKVKVRGNRADDYLALGAEESLMTLIMLAIVLGI